MHNIKPVADILTLTSTDCSQEQEI